MSEKILLSQTVYYQTINQDVNFVNQLNINIQKFFDKIQGLIQKNHAQSLKKNTIHQTVLNLTDQYLYWESSGKKFTILLEDIVGVFEEEIFFDLPNYLDHKFLLIINSYPINVNTLKGNQKRKFQQNKFFFLDPDVRDSWLNTIKNILHIPAKRNLQIIVNPYSGKGQAEKILRKILPIFQHTNLAFSISKNNLVETEKFIKNLDLSGIDGLVIIGGDGTIHQIINILINRPDWQKYHHIPLGIIPGGTSNGLSKSILELAGQDYDLINATLLIIRGKYQPLDIVKIQQYDNKNAQHKNNNYQNSYSFLSVAWGLISDVDIESDHLRFLGTLKTDIYALFKVLTLNSYQGKIFLLNPINKKTLKSNDLLDFNITTDFYQLDTSYNLSSENWQKVISEDFILLWVLNPRWAAYNLKTAPDAEISDGKIDVLILKKGVKKWQILQAFLLCSTGQHIFLDWVEYYQAEGLVLEPLTTSGNLAIDGEKYDYLPIKLTIVQNLINIFS
jgi:sphingosine kinase